MVFSEGFKGADEALQQSQLRRSNVYRFWLKPGEGKVVTFIDERAFSFPEHGYAVAGKWGNYVTCPGADKGCPFCAGDNNPYRVTVFTIIDHTEFRTKRGETIRDQKKILAAREEQTVTLRDLMAKWGGLKAKRVLVQRGTNKRSPVWGGNFSLDMANGQIAQTDFSKYKREFLTPFNYEELFKLRSIQELQMEFQKHQASMYNSEQGGGYGSDMGQVFSNPQQFMQPPAQQFQQQGFNQQPQQSAVPPGTQFPQYQPDAEGTLPPDDNVPF